MTNLTIANILLASAILCMVLSMAAAIPLFFFYSTIATAMAGAVRWHQLPHEAKARRKH